MTASPAAIRILALLCLAPFLPGQQDPRTDGPTSLVIEYRCNPGMRPQLRQWMVDNGVRQYDEWKRNGMLAEFHILFSRYVDSNQWDMLALIRFNRYKDAANWRSVERANPAGLPEATLAWVTQVNSYPMDLMRERLAESAPASSVHPVYLVTSSTLTADPPTYLHFFDAYDAPQFDAMMRTGIVSQYQMFLQRYTVARPWDTLSIVQFKDDDSFGQREQTLDKARQNLAGTPEWQRAIGQEQNIRADRESVIADELTAARR